MQHFIAWIKASAGEIVSHKKGLVIPYINRNESGSYSMSVWFGMESE